MYDLHLFTIVRVKNSERGHSISRDRFGNRDGKGWAKKEIRRLAWPSFGKNPPLNPGSDWKMNGGVLKIRRPSARRLHLITKKFLNVAGGKQVLAIHRSGYRAPDL